MQCGSRARAILGGGWPAAASLPQCHVHLPNTSSSAILWACCNPLGMLQRFGHAATLWACCCAGTLCVFDFKPRRFDASKYAMLVRH
jgi:hypothetical protein